MNHISPIVDRHGLGGNYPPEEIGLKRADELEQHLSDEINKLIEETRPTYEIFLRMPDQIETGEIYERATTLAARIATALNRIETARKAQKDPYTKAGSKIDALFKLEIEFAENKILLSKALTDAHAAVKARLSDYDTRQYLEQKKKAEAEAADLKAALESDGVVLDAQAASHDKLDTIRSQHGGISVRAVVKTFTIEDPKLVPASLCSPDPEKIQALIDSGATSIPGISIQERVQTHVKRR